MKKFTLLSFLFVFFISFQLQAQKKQAGLDLKKLDEYIAKAQTDWNIPAVAVAVVKDGKVLFAKGYGTRNLSLKTAADENTLFAIASNSKAFTTTGLALMVDKGKLKWDDKVIKHLPWFESYDPYVTANMTVRDLITHRSGLGTFSGDVLWYHTNYSAKEVVRRAKYLTPAKGFREGFGYQNIMFTAAGLVLEEVSGMSWGEFMKQNFLDPLEMKNTKYSVKQLDMAGNVAVPYQTEFDNSHTALNYLNWDNCAPAAAINSSVADMAKWMIFQLNNGKIADKQVVSEQQIWELRKMATPTPVSLGAFKNNPNTHFSGYGMGWSLNDYNGKKVISHGGGSDGMISKVAMIPEENFGVVVLTNNINYLSNALTNQIFDMYFGNPDKDWSKLYFERYSAGNKQAKEEREKFATDRIQNTKPSFELSAYEGTYHSEAYGNVKVSKGAGEKLVFEFEPAADLISDLTHYHFDIFSIKMRNNPALPEGTVQFIQDTKGKIMELKLDIPNPDFFFDEYKFIKL